MMRNYEEWLCDAPESRSIFCRGQSANAYQFDMIQCLHIEHDRHSCIDSITSSLGVDEYDGE